MMQPRDRPGFGQASLSGDRVRGVSAFDGDMPLQTRILGEEDLAHLSAAQPGQHAGRHRSPWDQRRSSRGVECTDFTPPVPDDISRLILTPKRIVVPPGSRRIIPLS